MFFLDVQGTLIGDEDKSPIRGAKELIARLNATNTPYLILTNNTKNLNFLESLRQKGLEIKEGAYLDPLCVLREILSPCKVAAFGSTQFLQSLEILGFGLDFQDPDAVLLASHDAFEFGDFARMVEFAQKGVRFIALHETSIYKKDGRAYPGVGAIMRMINYAAALKYEVVGKPSKAFYESALGLLKHQDEGAEFSKVLIVSDDFRGDLCGAKALGMRTALVLSGKISSTDGLDVGGLDFVYQDVGELLKRCVF